MAQVGFRGERLDLLARQGATLGPFIVTLTNPDLNPVNLTGCTIQGQVRQNALDATKVADFVVTIIDAVAGKFSFEIPHTVTALILAGEFQKDPKSIYQWDMELLDTSNRITPLYYGEYENFREVTRVV
jgi:hypothetical protein